MQQFLIIIVFSAYICSAATASLLTSKDVECGSKAIIGDIDLASPPKVERIEEHEDAVVIVPIESALSGVSNNAPTAFIGAARIKVPLGSSVAAPTGCTEISAP